MRKSLRLTLFGMIVLVIQLAGPSVSTSEPASPASFTFSSQEQGLGPEYQLGVPSNPETDRYAPASAFNQTSRQTLVVWHRHGGGFYYIEGRLIDARGKPVGSQPTILVSGATPIYQPAVAYNATNNQYLLVWMRNTNLDGKTYAIWGKILGANLTEARPEYEILSPVSDESLWSPCIAWNWAHNEYMVVLNSFDVSGWPSMVPESLIERTVYGNGDMIINAIPVIYNESPDHMIFPQQVDIAFTNDGSWGKYIWVWKQVKPNTADYDIWAANIDAYLGGYVWPLTPWKVDDSTTEQTSPRIATNGANNFMIVWQERNSSSPYDWDIRGRNMNQIGTFYGDLQIVAGYGSTDETNPTIVAWPGTGRSYAVVYERPSETGQGVWISYNNNDTNTLNSSGYNFWLDNFRAADYGFWTNSYPTGVVTGSVLQIAYQGVSNTPGDHSHIYSRTWSPFLVNLPMIRR